MELQNLLPESPFSKEPWRCDHCKKLIYNTDKDGYAIAGAPIAHYYNIKYQNLCNVCFYLVTNLKLTTTYWKNAQEAWELEQVRNKANKNRLLGGSDWHKE
jgi:hypothetical protein